MRNNYSDDDEKPQPERLARRHAAPVFKMEDGTLGGGCPACRRRLILKDPRGLMGYCPRCDDFYVREPAGDRA